MHRACRKRGALVCVEHAVNATTTSLDNKRRRPAQTAQRIAQLALSGGWNASVAVLNEADAMGYRYWILIARTQVPGDSMPGQ
jgi:hypothetical protein